ncbi:MAG: peptidoglycan-binding protein [Desulfobacteraceae bacterium]|nr:peptidoglycan-binding protein [Desulfobacteraceae bacterium]
MDLQGRNLKARNKGDDVRVLHSELRKLGYRISDREYSQLYFGAATQKAVKHFQGKHDLLPTGVVDKRTAKIINREVAALEPQPTGFVVKGQVRLRNQNPVPGVVVKAYDKDLRSEELLGEAVTDNQGYYRIKYTAKQFRRAEKKRADLFVRGFDKSDKKLDQSDVIFNAKKAEIINLEVPKPTILKLSEYELLLHALEPVLDGLAPAELTGEDIQFLLKELTGEQVVNRRRLNFLAQGARLARDTKLPTEFFYGLARQLQLKPPLALEPFLALTPSVAGQALLNAFRCNIIPAKLRASVKAMLGRLEQLKLERGVLKEYQLTGRLLNEETGKALVGYRVRASHQHGDERPKDLGFDTIDRAGRFSFTIITLPGTAEDAPDRPTDLLRLSILNSENEEIHKAEFEIKPDQPELPDVKVPVQALPKPPVRPVKEVADSLGLELPERFASFLTERKIHSIEDIRRAGGLARVKDLPLAMDDPAVKMLDAQANLSTLSTTVEENARFAAKGFDSISAIATAPRKIFVSSFGKDMGDVKALQVHAVAKAQQRLLDSVLAGIGTDIANGQVPMMWRVAEEPPGLEELGGMDVVEDPFFRKISEMFADTCECRDCEAAVSPGAYLADLLSYALKHVKREEGELDITLEELANLVHQPLGDLSASCEASKEKVRQVRLCVEVLRHYIDECLSDEAEQTYRFSAYTMLLTKLGTSYEKLRLARTDDEKARQSLAQRLGIDLSSERPDELDALLMEPEAITEASLEKLFGLVDTTRDPLNGGITEGDTRGQITRWQLEGVEWNRNTDRSGLIYVGLSHPSGSVYRVTLYRDSARDQEVAAGLISRAQGTVQLSPRNNSGLSGTIELEFSRESNDIELVAVPEFLSWRLQHLRTLWQAEDGIADPYTRNSVSPYTEADLLPVIDPDLIGPDDFRTPFEKTNETDSDRPFDLWIMRRSQIDGRLKELRELRKSFDHDAGPEALDTEVFITLLEQFYHRIDIDNVFDKIAENLAPGGDIEAAERQICIQYRLTVESFQRLREIQAKAEKLQRLAEEARTGEPDRLTEEDWEEVIAILVQAEKRDWFSGWREEEQSLEASRHHSLFSPRYFWTSLREPVEGSWRPATTEELPLIDPELVALDDLPEPTAGQRAIALWHARRALLDEAFNKLKTEHETNDFTALLIAALGDPPADEDWEAHLSGLLDSARVAEVSGHELDDVQLELDDFGLRTIENLSRLLKIHNAEDASESEWDEVYAILTSCRKQREGWPSRWHEEEQDDPVLKGRYWLASKARLPKWQASASDRAAWKQALRSRSRAPIIDPDLINLNYLKDMTSGTAYGLRKGRRQWIEEDRLTKLLSLHTAASTPFEGFEDMLIDSLFDLHTLPSIESQYQTIRETNGIDDLLRQALGQERDILEELLTDLDSPDTETSHNAVQAITQRLFFSVDGFRQLMRLISEEEWEQIYATLAHASLVASVMALDFEREQGKDVASRLSQFGLTNAVFSYLVRFRNLLIGDASIQDSEWDDIYSIFLQVLKNRESADWKQEEQEQSISLSPDHFKIPETPPLQFPPPEPEPLPGWRASERDLRQWRNTLKCRIEQGETAIAAMHDAVGAVEEETLPGLRNALIMATDIEESDLASKAKRLTDLLLIDTQAGGCQQTTRISQAIETVKGLLESLRTGQLQDTYENLILLADNFDEEWKWIGSYATWRAAMFVFLYPENILLPSLCKHKTPAFKDFQSRMRTNRQLTPKSACEAAQEYADYFEDICNLEVVATCTAKTRIHKDDDCQIRSTDDVKDLFYMFAVGSKTKTLYWSVYDQCAKGDYPQSFWRSVPGMERKDFINIPGAVPYQVTSKQRFIFLFVYNVEQGEKKLVFSKYDLENGEGWINEPQELELPSETDGLKKILAAQFFHDKTPPLLSLHVSGKIYTRMMNNEGTGWSEKDSTSSSEDEDNSNEWQEFDEIVADSVRIKKLHAVLVMKFNQEVPFDVNDLPSPPLFFNYVVCLFIYTRQDNGRLFVSRALNVLWDSRVEFASFTDELSMDEYDKYLGSFLWSNGHEVYFYYYDSIQASIKYLRYYQLVGSSGYEDIAIRRSSSYNSEIISSYFTKIVPDFSLSSDDIENKQLVYQNYSGRLGGYRTTFGRENDSLLEEVGIEVAPFVPPSIFPGPFDITEKLTPAELQLRRINIQSDIHYNLDGLKSNLAYLKEAFCFVPVHLALQLQRHDHFTNALDWFRTVYDYSAPPDKRKIYYELEREEIFSSDSRRFEDWLLDPLNPHHIAGTRYETYSRFTLIALARCLLDYADAEFSIDTAESIPRARTLYITALELLDTEALQQGLTRTCDELIGEFEIELGREFEASEPEHLLFISEIISGLHKVGTTKALSGTIENLKRVLVTDESLEMRLTRALDIIGGVPTPGPKVLGEVVAGHKDRIENAQRLLLSRSKVAEIVSKINDTVERRLRQASTEFTMEIPEWEESETETVDRFETVLKASGFYFYQPGLSFDFCIPPNPVLDALRLRAELNLYKIRTCRNIAGMERQLDPYAAPTDTFSGMPQIGAGGQLVLPGTVTLQPTPYRYQVLMERAKQLAQMAAQFEAGMLAALEKRDAEAYQVMKAGQDVQLTRQGLRLQELRVREAENGVDLAELQLERTVVLAEEYQALIDAGLTKNEWVMIDAYNSSNEFRIAATVAGATGQVAQVWASVGVMDPVGKIMAGIASAAYAVQAAYTGLAISKETEAQVANVWANYERRKQEWELQIEVANQDIAVGNQQITLANDRVRVVGQERKIAEMQADHAKEVVDFLANKFTNVELYDWMSGVLEGVYSFFLQQATAMAKLAENQVAFERQEIPPAYIQADYWEAPSDMALESSAGGGGPDRRGLTGSARLQQDIHQLDLYAFKTDQRKQQLTKTISLAQRAPGEFERFRQTGVMVFETSMNLFDHGFPGHYLRLIKRVSTSVLALIPPTAGIHATLSTTGLSRVVIGSSGLFQKIDVRRYPESVALTSPINATGLFELTPQNKEMLLPFESMGVDTMWEFRMPRAANQFDYSTIADVLITIDYTALNDFSYRQQVIRELEDSISGDRPFSFRHQLPDQWYYLNNADPAATSIIVRFETRRADYPPNIDDLQIQQVLLYFARADGTAFEVDVTHLHFTELGSPGPVGGGATSNEGLISTRSANAGSWLSVIGKAPIGQWELALPNTTEMRERFKNSEIENILFVITYEGRTPEWPA